MNWFDLIILVIVIFSFVRGYMSGLVMQLASLAGLIAGAFFAGKLAAFISPYIIEWTQVAIYIVKPLSYIMAFVLIMVAFIFVGKIIHSLLKAIKINFLNRFAGSFFSVVKWLILASILINLLLMVDRNERIIKSDVKEKSITYPYVKAVAPFFIPFLKFEDRNKG